MSTGYTDDHARSGIDTPLPAIDTWPSQFKRYEIETVVPEFTSVCPKTGLPDFGKLTVRYTPADKCFELKSFKMYILAYRDLGIFYENAVNRILRDLVAALEPIEITVVGEFTPRGGISTTVRASWLRGDAERSGF